MTVARRALETLLKRGEAKVSRGLPFAQATLALSAKSFPEYVALRTLDEQNDFDATIELAKRQGAISAMRTREGGDGSGFSQLRVADLAKLAEFLGMSLRQAQVDMASDAVAAFRLRFPILDEIIRAWRLGKNVRGKSSAHHAELLDALRLVEARNNEERYESILRRESARLFGNSKRIEYLTPWLDVLTSGELVSSGLSEEEILSQLGLRREPQPILLSGFGSARVSGEITPLCQPFIGLPIGAIESFQVEPAFVLTIENLTSFHDTVRRFPGNAGLIIYTGGMPSPAWRSLYKKLLSGLSPTTPIHHWGDVDEGGFRIAAKLAEQARLIYRNLQPWLMSPIQIGSDHGAYGNAPSPQILKAMIYWAKRAGWEEVIADLVLEPIRIEQEAIQPRLPI